MREEPWGLQGWDHLGLGRMLWALKEPEYDVALIPSLSGEEGTNKTRKDMG